MEIVTIVFPTFNITYFPGIESFSMDLTKWFHSCNIGTFTNKFSVIVHLKNLLTKITFFLQRN